MSEVPLVMPKMSMTMTEGVLVAWHKSAGDPVRAGDVVCEVTTDKVDMEVESPVEGVLARTVAEPEDVVAVGEPIAFITAEADDLLAGLFDGPAPEPAVPADLGTGAPDPGPAGASGSGWIPSVPRARGLAAELGVELSSLTGTGPGGVVRVADVEAAAPAGRNGRAPAPVPARPAPAAVTNGRPSAAERRRAALARKMTESAAVPQFVVFRDLDLEALSTARGTASWNAVLVKAYATALRAEPRMLATWDGERARPLDTVAVAVAVDTRDGLLSPVLADPDRLPLADLDAALRALADRARRGKLAVADLAPAATTVSNLGGLGVESFTALLTPPQATALSLGAVEHRVVAEPGAVVARLRCRAGLSVDHRVADGADAARLLARMQRLCHDAAALR